MRRGKLEGANSEVFTSRMLASAWLRVVCSAAQWLVPSALTIGAREIVWVPECHSLLAKVNALYEANGRVQQLFPLDRHRFGERNGAGHDGALVGQSFGRDAVGALAVAAFEGLNRSPPLLPECAAEKAANRVRLPR